ncbi:MAG TPA: AAA family ATPase [Solirubrobacteraceae bacterium]|jgi:predicted kinase
MHSETDRAGAVVVAGPPASGKTTLGAALARVLHHAFIDLDIVTGTMTRAALALAAADETALDGEIGAQLRDARYGALLETAAAQIGVGLGVVLSGPFTRERTDPACWDALRERLDCPDATLICLELDEPARRERMRARGAVRDREKMAAPVAGDRGTPIPDAIRLDGGARPEVVLDAALTALDEIAGNLSRPEVEQPSPRPC